MDIGFVGLGHMGLPMAINLVKAGHRVQVFDLNQSAVEKAVAIGAIGVKRLADLHLSSVFITMLQTGEQVTSVCLGEDGLYAMMRTGDLHVDCSSIDIASCQLLHQSATRLGLACLDAPVSGGVMGARNATLTFMIGGHAKTVKQTQSLFEAMGKTIVHTGDAGTGQAAKICNNMILGISMAAISEAFVLGEQLGLSPEKLFEVSSTASGQCWAMTSYCPVPGLVEAAPSNNHYQPGFSAEMMLKDLKLSQNAASLTKMNTQLGATATALYQAMVDSGEGQRDFSAIIKRLSSV